MLSVADGGDVGIARSIFHLGDTDTSIGFSANDTIIIKTADSFIKNKYVVKQN